MSLNICVLVRSVMRLKYACYIMEYDKTGLLREFEQDLIYVFPQQPSSKKNISFSRRCTSNSFKKDIQSPVFLDRVTQPGTTFPPPTNSGCVTRYTTRKPLPNQDNDVHGIACHPQSPPVRHYNRPPPCHAKAKSNIDSQLLADLLPLSVDPLRRALSVLSISPCAIP